MKTTSIQHLKQKRLTGQTKLDLLKFVQQSDSTIPKFVAVYENDQLNKCFKLTADWLISFVNIVTGPLPFKAAVCERWSDFTHSEKLRVASCTWNVNGGKLIRSIALRGNQSLDDWLLDGPVRSGAVKEHVSVCMLCECVCL